MEDILKTINPSVLDLNDGAYDEAEGIVGRSAGNYEPFPVITPNVVPFSLYQNSEQKIKFQYASDWKKYME